MTHKIVLPTFDEANAALASGLDTPLEEFIYDNEPSGLNETANFRDGLEKLIVFIIENVDSFGLTLDADGTTVESTSTSEPVENDRPKACPQDRHKYYILSTSHEFCPYCGERLSS